jgi:hypothetical protein
MVTNNNVFHPVQTGDREMEKAKVQEYNRNAIWMVAVCMATIIGLAALASASIHGHLPAFPSGSPRVAFFIASIISGIGIVQCYRIGAGTDDFIFGGTVFTVEVVKEHGLVLPSFVMWCSSNFLLIILCTILMLVLGLE